MRPGTHQPRRILGVNTPYAYSALYADYFIDEALHRNSPAFSQKQPASGATPRASRESRPRVIVADDNADMREYASRLLRDRYAVETVPDGAAALSAARRSRPAAVVTDIMMPVMDGLELLRAIREDYSLRTVPVILLSARAGDEALLEGIEHQADDYLVKPFSARS